MNFNDLPKGCSKRGLSKIELASDPTEQLQLWLEDAREAKVKELNAMALATASLEGKPSCRMVLLKHVDEKGLVFFTNYHSRKSREIELNPQAMITLFWKEMTRQICVEGTVEKTSSEESMQYFLKRPRGSQIGAWASEQDEVVSSRKVLEKEYEEVEKKYHGQQIPLPPHWGGYRIVPKRFEFWQGREHRLHDRFHYVKEQGLWKKERLAP